MELTWHGHSTWHVTVGATDLLIDPFFDNPKTDIDRTALDPDYVLITHGHADHVGDVHHYEGTTLVATPELVAYCQDEYGEFEAVGGMGMNLGGTVECGDAYVTMVRADHTNGIETGYGTSGGMPAGFVLSDTKPTQASDTDSTTFYDAGDTSLMVAMRDIIAPYLEPDVAAVPIGDRFTMGPTQAAVAVDWLGVDTALPMHYDTFPPIEQDPRDFVRELEATAADAESVVLEADESIELGRRRYGQYASAGQSFCGSRAHDTTWQTSASAARARRASRPTTSSRTGS